MSWNEIMTLLFFCRNLSRSDKGEKGCEGTFIDLFRFRDYRENRMLSFGNQVVVPLEDGTETVFQRRRSGKTSEETRGKKVFLSPS